MHISVVLLATVIVSLTTSTPIPVERKRDGPLVVDVPAGMFETDNSDDIAPLPAVQEKELDVIQPQSGEIIEEVDLKKPESGTFGIHVPTIFVIRRPTISDRFPFFQSQSPFQGFRPFSAFENRRPVFQRPVMGDSDYEESTHDMVSHMEQMMKRMQQQMSSLWGSFATPSFQRPLRPLFPSFESSETDGTNDTIVTHIDNLPANYSNSTSETKVIDGHVVQVNKTIHKISSGNNNSGFFQFEVINVRPTEGTKTETPITINIPDSTDVKPVENPTSQAQPQQPQKSEDPSLNEVGGTKSDRNEQELKFPYLMDRRRLYQPKLDQSPEVEWIPRTEYERPLAPNPTTGRRITHRSLDDDIYVNRLIQDQKLLSPYLILNPDVELFDV